MWNYKCHSILTKIIRAIERPLEISHNLSWTYAHYRNGSYVKINGTFFKEKSFMWCLKSAMRKFDDS